MLQVNTSIRTAPPPLPPPPYRSAPTTIEKEAPETSLKQKNDTRVCRCPARARVWSASLRLSPKQPDNHTPRATTLCSFHTTTHRPHHQSPPQASTTDLHCNLRLASSSPPRPPPYRQVLEVARAERGSQGARRCACHTSIFM